MAADSLVGVAFTVKRNFTRFDAWFGLLWQCCSQNWTVLPLNPTSEWLCNLRFRETDLCHRILGKMSSRRRKVYLTGRGMVVDKNRHFLLVENEYPFVPVQRKYLYYALNTAEHSASLPRKVDHRCKMQKTGHPSPKATLACMHIHICRNIFFVESF